MGESTRIVQVEKGKERGGGKGWRGEQRGHVGRV